MDEKDLVQALTEVIKDDEKQIEELKQRLEFVTERRERNKNLLNSILKIEEFNSQNGGEELWIESHQSKPNPDSNYSTNQNTIDSVRKSNSHSGDNIASERVHSIVDIRTEKITRSPTSF
jgi:vacuolar-type H+-ATPase subunit I/STV1